MAQDMALQRCHVAQRSCGVDELQFHQLARGIILSGERTLLLGTNTTYLLFCRTNSSMLYFLEFSVRNYRVAVVCSQHVRHCIA
jgi:hypothetical protein